MIKLIYILLYIFAVQVDLGLEATGACYVIYVTVVLFKRSSRKTTIQLNRGTAVILGDFKNLADAYIRKLTNRGLKCFHEELYLNSSPALIVVFDTFPNVWKVISKAN
jgi:hypothetical protein